MKRKEPLPQRVSLDTLSDYIYQSLSLLFNKTSHSVPQSVNIQFPVRPRGEIEVLRHKIQLSESSLRFSQKALPPIGHWKYNTGQGFAGQFGLSILSQSSDPSLEEQQTDLPDLLSFSTY